MRIYATRQAYRARPGLKTEDIDRYTLISSQKESEEKPTLVWSILLTSGRTLT
jgi:hypothetical protein